MDILKFVCLFASHRGSCTSRRCQNHSNAVSRKPRNNCCFLRPGLCWNAVLFVLPPAQLRLSEAQVNILTDNITCFLAQFCFIFCPKKITKTSKLFVELNKIN